MLSVYNQSIKEFTDQQQKILLSLYQNPQAKGEGLGVNKMTKDKRWISGAQWTVAILAALMFGAFLGSPGPEDWTSRLVQYISSDRPVYEASGVGNGCTYGNDRVGYNTNRAGNPYDNDGAGSRGACIST